VDTGLTTAFLKGHLIKQKPASLRICALVDKPSRRRTAIDIEYTGFTVPNIFIVGYGLDWNEKYRNLPDIYAIQEHGDT
jgi:hypoxanthine phosphoribosyltransferase